MGAARHSGSVQRSEFSVVGNQVTQGQAVLRVGDRRILVVSAALGDRCFPHSGQFVAMPSVPRPSESRVRIRLDQDESLSGRVEQRPVKFRPWETLGRTVPTEWVLLDIHIQVAERGFAHGSVNMYAEDGTLLAVAGQSCVVRFWDNPQDRSLEPVEHQENQS